MSRNMNQRLQELEKQVEYLVRQRETQPRIPTDLKHRARIIANAMRRAREERDPEKIAIIAKSLKEAQRRLNACRQLGSKASL